MTVMNTLSDGRILRSFTRGVVPCPQPGATLLVAARAEFESSSSGVVRVRKVPGSSADGKCGFWGTSPGSSR